MLASEHFNPIYGTYDALKNIKGGPFEMDIFLRATREGLLSLEFQGKIFSLFQEQLQRASTHLRPLVSVTTHIGFHHVFLVTFSFLLFFLRYLENFLIILSYERRGTRYNQHNTTVHSTAILRPSSSPTNVSLRAL